MLKRKSKGWFAWGTVSMISAVFWGFLGIEMIFDMKYLELGLIVSIPGLISLALAVFLFVMGGVKASRVNKHNARMRDLGEIDECECPYCRITNRVKRIEFMSHRRYPEGFVYCKSCKKPISYNAFKVVYISGQNENAGEYPQ